MIPGIMFNKSVFVWIIDVFLEWSRRNRFYSLLQVSAASSDSCLIGKSALWIITTPNAHWIDYGPRI